MLASATREHLYDSLRPQLSSKARGLTDSSPHEKKIIYVHVPKTGGYSISRSLRDAHALSDDAPHFLRHFNLQQLWDQGVDLTNTEKYILVVTVRNPYDHVHSLWEYYRHVYPAELQSQSFMEFVSNPPQKRYIISDHLYYNNGTHNIMPEFVIIHFESLEKDFKLFCSVYGFECSLDHLNQNIVKSTTKPKNDYEVVPPYTPEMREVIESLYRNDLYLFNYSYNSFVANWVSRR